MDLMVYMRVCYSRTCIRYVAVYYDTKVRIGSCAHDNLYSLENQVTY
jgi:hypothetical protein